jgi:hypothetical protein
MTLPEPIIIKRLLTGPLVELLGLPRGCLGTPFIQPAANPAYAAAVAKWWNELPEEARFPREVLATLASPSVVADIRIFIQNGATGALHRTMALAGGAEAGAPWILMAHSEAPNQYQVQPLPDRETLVNTLFAALEAGMPVWEAGMRFQMPTDEFGILLALVDLHSRGNYASMITHNLPPVAFSPGDIGQAHENATRVSDPRYLFPFTAPLLPEGVLQLTPERLQESVRALTARGLLEPKDDGVAWTQSGSFFAESMHRRVCLVSLEMAGARADGVPGTQCALFARSDRPLWYFDIDRDASRTVAAAAISSQTARGLLDELLKPTGVPMLQSEIDARTRVPTAAPLRSGASAQPPAPPEETPLPAVNFCLQCGNAIGATTRFCGRCGQKVR